jgi:hypothetical protein
MIAFHQASRPASSSTCQDEPRRAVARCEDQQLRLAGRASERRAQREARADDRRGRVEPGRERDTARRRDGRAVDPVRVAGVVEVDEQLARPDAQPRVALREAQVAAAGRVGLRALERELRVGIGELEQRALPAEEPPRGLEVRRAAGPAARRGLELLARKLARRADPRPQVSAHLRRPLAQEPAQSLARIRGRVRSVVRACFCAFNRSAAPRAKSDSFCATSEGGRSPPGARQRALRVGRGSARASAPSARRCGESQRHEHTETEARPLRSSQRTRQEYA